MAARIAGSDWNTNDISEEFSLFDSLMRRRQIA